LAAICLILVIAKFRPKRRVPQIITLNPGMKREDSPVEEAATTINQLP